MFQWLEDKIKKNSNAGQEYEPGTSKNTTDVEERNLNQETSSIGESIELTVISSEGAIWKVEVSVEMKIAKFKNMLLNHFYNPVDPAKIDNLYKLILVSERRTLAVEKTIMEEKIESRDEILLSRQNKRPSTSQKEYSAPTPDEIQEATAYIEPKNVQNITPLLDCAESYNAETRKIMLTFVFISTDLLAHRPDVVSTIKSLSKRLKEEHETQPCRQDVGSLVDMGFSQERAKHALKLKRNNQAEALEWLLESENLGLQEDNFEEPLLEARSSSGQKGELVSSIVTIVEVLKLMRRQEFLPNKGHLSHFVDMGFDKVTSVRALQLTGNNFHYACDWMLGEKSREEVDTDEPYSRDSRIFKIYLNNPIILAGLSKPKTLLAFLSILENRNTTSLWMADPDTQPVFTEIFKIHHIERHSISPL